MPVLVRVEGGPFAGLDRRTMRGRAEKMLLFLRRPDAELSIAFVTDTRIHELNRDYRGKNKPTDVLAFAMNEGAHGGINAGLLGDVIISVDTANRQALAARKTVLEEMTMLLAHGLLHVLGWDHETAAKDRAMRAETDRLVAAAKNRIAANVKLMPQKPRKNSP